MNTKTFVAVSLFIVIFSAGGLLLKASEEADHQAVLVDIQKVDSSIVVDLKYATSDNFMNEVLYESPGCFLRPSVAKRLLRVQRSLQKKDLGLKIFDGYRPLRVQKKMFARFPFPGYVADPKKGSNHNRAAAVDVTLVNATGGELAMPSEYDEFSERSHLDYEKCTAEEKRNRELLQQAMKQEGFVPISTEWWHFNDPDAQSFALLDIPLKDAIQ